MRHIQAPIEARDPAISNHHGACFQCFLDVVGSFEPDQLNSAIVTDKLSSQTTATASTRGLNVGDASLDLDFRRTSHAGFRQKHHRSVHVPEGVVAE